PWSFQKEKRVYIYSLSISISSSSSVALRNVTGTLLSFLGSSSLFFSLNLACLSLFCSRILANLSTLWCLSQLDILMNDLSSTPVIPISSKVFRASLTVDNGLLKIVESISSVYGIFSLKKIYPLEFVFPACSSSLMHITQLVSESGICSINRTFSSSNIDVLSFIHLTSLTQSPPITSTRFIFMIYSVNYISWIAWLHIRT